MLLRIWIFLALSTLASAGPALGKEPSEPGSIPPEAEVRYKAKTEIDFGDRRVSGQLTGPVGVYSESLADNQWNPLIRLKTDFGKEILASVQAIR